MNVQANNNGGPTGANRKYPDENNYVADMGRYLYDPEVFSNVPIDTLRRYQQRHNSLSENYFTAACYAVMTPKEELIKIMKQVGVEMLQPETDPFRMDDTPNVRDHLQKSGCCGTQETTQPLHG